LVQKTQAKHEHPGTWSRRYVESCLARRPVFENLSTLEDALQSLLLADFSFINPDGILTATGKFPNQPGIYAFYLRDKCLYVGKAKSLSSRIRSHQQSFPSISAWVEKHAYDLGLHFNNVADQWNIDDIPWDEYTVKIWLCNQIQPAILEHCFIRDLKPKYNVVSGG
jgi:hypothetical protein